MAENPTLLRICGIIGLIGAVFPVAADVSSWIVAENYNPVAQSISGLAVGRSSWLIDLGLWAFTAGCLAVAAGLCRWLGESRYRTAAVLFLVLLAVCVGVVARLNQYAGTDNPGANTHLWAVCGIGVSFALASLLAVPGLRTRSASYGRLSMILGLVYIVICPIYWFFTDEWSGAVERLLAVIMLIWIGTISRAMLETTRQARLGVAAGP